MSSGIILNSLALLNTAAVSSADVAYYRQEPIPSLNLITHVYICVSTKTRNLFVCLVMKVWLEAWGHKKMKN